MVALSAILGSAGGWAKVEPQFTAQSDQPETIGTRLSEDALKATATRLQDRGLTSITLFRDLDGRISASGMIKPEQVGEWSSAKRWFDGRFGAKLAFVDNVILPRNEVVLPFEISGVTGVAQMNVILHDGSKYAVGDLLPGGWRIDHVDAGGLELSRDSEVLALSF